MGDTSVLSARRRDSPGAEPDTVAAAGVRWGDRRKSSAPPVPRPPHRQRRVDVFREIGMSAEETEKRWPANIIA